MSWFKKLFGRPVAGDSTLGQQPPEQRLMTLEERMAFRREMVFESVREVMVNHNLPPLSYKLNVARLDTRGHRYAVMIDLVPQLAGRVADSPGEWQAMEAQAMRTAANRYRIKIANVYWRLEPQGFGSVHDGATLASTPSQRWRVLEAETAQAALQTDSPVKAVSAPTEQDGFPDTLVEDRRPVLETISQEEILAFQAAMQSDQTAQRPVHLGSKTYQTDFMPLV